MSAKCWGCENRVTPVGASEATLPLDPLGTCWDCQVLGCRAHGYRDLGSGKWVCYPDVAKAASVSGGLEISEDVAAEVAVRFTSSYELAERFPVLAEETEEERRYWASGAGEGQLGNELREEGLELRNFHLIADAIGIARFLQPRVLPSVTEKAHPPMPIFPGRLGQFVAKLGNDR